MKDLKKCLLIDDDLYDQEIFQMCLEKVNASVEFKAIDNAIEAISKLTSESNYIPDYIFIDVNMPKMNGIECLKIIAGFLKKKKYCCLVK